jgi:CheY-like chemotaxis protein
VSRVLLIRDGRGACRVSLAHELLLIDGHEVTEVKLSDSQEPPRVEGIGLVVVDFGLRLGLEERDLQGLRARSAFPDAPALALTSSGLPGDRERFLAAGFDRCLSKPFGTSLFRETVGNLLLAYRSG